VGARGGKKGVDVWCIGLGVEEYGRGGPGKSQDHQAKPTIVSRMSTRGCGSTGKNHKRAPGKAGFLGISGEGSLTERFSKTSSTEKRVSSVAVKAQGGFNWSRGEKKTKETLYEKKLGLTGATWRGKKELFIKTNEDQKREG